MNDFRFFVFLECVNDEDELYCVRCEVEYSDTVNTQEAAVDKALELRKQSHHRISKALCFTGKPSEYHVITEPQSTYTFARGHRIW